MSAQNRALLYVLLVFFSGSIAGALGMHLVEHFWLHPQQAAAAPNWPADRQYYIEQFKKELNLTDDQSKRLESILDDTMKQYEDLHSFTHRVRDDGLMQIRAMLDDNQRKQFDELTRRIETPEQRAKRRPSASQPPSK